ncbi:hypothetical protein HYQ46_010991 [Verticillium longisporum]|nr:hypothetical protein HYQ46_010991 [Verticillium longisporum]
MPFWDGAMDDPLVAPREDVGLVGIFGRRKLESLDSTGAAANDGNLLALGALARQLARVVDRTLELFNAYC